MAVRLNWLCVMVGCLLMAGCNGERVVDDAAAAGSGAESTAPSGDDAAGDSGSADSAEAASTLALEPANTQVEFVGTHTGDKPDPRVGTFSEFSGKLGYDAESASLQSITMEIQTQSLETSMPKLTDHLKSPDFLDVREYPTISFQSSSIASGEGAGMFNVTGNLTMHGETKEVSFPVNFSVLNGGVPTLSSEFQIDRTEFGMDYGTDRVEKQVALTVTVNQTVPADEAAALEESAPASE